MHPMQYVSTALPLFSKQEVRTGGPIGTTYQYHFIIFIVFIAHRVQHDSRHLQGGKLKIFQHFLVTFWLLFSTFQFFLALLSTGFPFVTMLKGAFKQPIFQPHPPHIGSASPYFNHLSPFLATPFFSHICPCLATSASFQPCLPLYSYVSPLYIYNYSYNILDAAPPLPEHHLATSLLS